MGIELGLGSILQLAVGAAGVISGTVAAGKSRRARQEARNVSVAQQQIQDRIAKRRAAKEARIKRARLLQAAETSGATGSSGLVGATSALGANFGAAVAGQRSGQFAAQGISAANQRAADAESTGARNEALFGLFSKGINLLDGEGLFG